MKREGEACEMKVLQEEGMAEKEKGKGEFKTLALQSTFLIHSGNRKAD